jgi:hypothetical protein
MTDQPTLPAGDLSSWMVEIPATSARLHEDDGGRTMSPTELAVRAVEHPDC